MAGRPVDANLDLFQVSLLRTAALDNPAFASRLHHILVWSGNFYVRWTTPFFGTPQPRLHLIGSGGEVRPIIDTSPFSAWEIIHCEKADCDDFFCALDRTNADVRAIIQDLRQQPDCAQ